MGFIDWFLAGLGVMLAYFAICVAILGVIGLVALWILYEQGKE